MNLHKWLAALFVMLAIGAPVGDGAGTGALRSLPSGNNSKYPHDRGGDGGGGGVGSCM
jgi:hypothetical protein